MKRRDFIRNSALGALSPFVIGKQSMWGMGKMNSMLLENDNVLVVVQLTGGNDGLNTVIPVSQYGNYKNARSNIAIAENKVLKIPQSDLIGLHPSLSGLAELMKDGKGGIVQDVGYPNPSFSHFKATDIWNSASDSNQTLDSGWAGRYLALKHPNFPNAYPSEKYPDPLAIQIGSVVTTSLQGPIYSMGMSISDTANFYDLLENPDQPAINALASKELNFLKQISKQSNIYFDTVQNAALKVKQQKEYPNLSLANQLKTVARLIAGGLKTKIYYVNLGGFDTHSAQTNASDTSTGTHANLMAHLSDSIKAFQDDLKFLGIQNKVLGMTYSEFGRRIKSNASLGTDHGAAAPMFFFGEKVNPAYFGKPMSISATVSNNDNIPMQFDFRAVYASMLKYWFCSENTELKNVLFKDFETLAIVSPSVCGYLTATEPNFGVKVKVFPNPFVDRITVSFSSLSSEVSYQLFDLKGREVIQETHVGITPGAAEVQLSVGQLRNEIYFLRLKTSEFQEVVRIIKN